jgi:hypothetical protein
MVFFQKSVFKSPKHVQGEAEPLLCTAVPLVYTAMPLVCTPCERSELQGAQQAFCRI